MQTVSKIEIVVTTLIGVLAFGTVAYHYIEGWGYIDSFYFTGITVMTIGYGDIAPVTNAGKIFTVFFAFVGVSLSLFAISLFATAYFEQREKKQETTLSERVLAVIKNNTGADALRRKKDDIIEGSGS